jgi:MOSC domain-containing protein YiiM
LPAVADVLNASLRACVAFITQVAVDGVPAAPAGADPWPATGWWLDARMLGVVPVARPEAFQWGGYWIARMHVDDAPADDDLHVVMAGTPSGVVHVPLDRLPDPAARIVAGWVIARPALVSLERGGRLAGVVAGLFLSPASGEPMEWRSSLTLVAGVGVEGDRYAAGLGRFSTPGRLGQELTLIEAEALEEAAAEHGVHLAPADTRRNVLTRGIDLNGLVGQRFTVGDVELVGRRLAEPCSHLQVTAPPGTLRALVHRGGLRAEIVSGGRIAVGEEIRSGPAGEPR